MNAPAIKTPAEQKLAWLESVNRPLTDDESDELRRSLHAVYCLPKLRASRAAKAARMEAELHAGALAEFDQGNSDILARVEREARG